ncbi:MAG: SAM-dependent methyltransferase [Chloroflexota bacterium]
MISQRADLTFKYNLKHGRHAWLRLTPAYSVKIVEQILTEHPTVGHVLDPFAGTGTTGLVCGQFGYRCDLVDLNPFLVWLTRVKTANYEPNVLLQAQKRTRDIYLRVADCIPSTADLWVPPIHNPTRWWPENRLPVLARIYREICQTCCEASPAKDLLLVAFCHLLIHWSNAAFNHQSISFKTNGGGQLSLLDEAQEIARSFVEVTQTVLTAAQEQIKGKVFVIQADSRYVPQPADHLYDCVITSPPYPNRMSYIRELRPYMYWLGYLKEASEAGEMDWQAIGGTWGVATSRLERWQPGGEVIAYPGFEKVITEIASQSPVLANYVHKYFTDVLKHLRSLPPTLSRGARVFYVVGNSKFYDTLVPVESIYGSLLRQCGFGDVKIEVLRKRNSKKELLEYVVSARKLC